MRTMLLVNGGIKDFGTKFRAACKEQSVRCISARAAHMAFHVHDGKVEVYVKNERLDLSIIDYAFLRVRGNYALTCSILLKLLKEQHIPFNDPVFAEHTSANGKMTQMVLFTLAGLAVPETWICNRKSLIANKKQILEAVSFPCVMKMLGSQGDSVWQVHSEADIRERLAERSNDEVFILQKFVPNTSDIRVLCAYGDCLGAIERSSTDGFYNNVSRGGNVRTIAITEQEKAMALKACEVMNMNFGGADIVRTEQGPMLFEVNGGPQTYGFERATGMNVPKELVTRIVKKLQS